MRTPTPNTWVFFFAAMNAVALGAACGDDNTATGTGTGSDTGSGGTTGTGEGGALVGSTSSTTSTSSSPTSTATVTSSSTGGDGGNGQGGEGTGGGNGGEGGGVVDLCGNGAIDEGETCDGIALDDSTCEEEGFVEGVLACSDDCLSYDTTGCETCGDGVMNGEDACDDQDFGDDTCGMHSFDQGDLACNDDCTLDLSECSDFSCDDGILNGTEVCSGTDFADGVEDCADLGFVSGALTCSDTCQFVTAACESCGNDVVDLDDECDAEDLDDQTCVSLSGLGFTGGTLACAGDCTFDVTDCTSFARPGAGEVVIAEIMINPSADNDTTEWFEIVNPSSTTGYQLFGCVVSGNTDNFTINADLELPAGGVVVLSRSATQPFELDYLYEDFILGNGGDFITLTCDSVEVDTVNYNDGAGGFVVPTNRSIQLDPGSFDADANDISTNWCNAQVLYGTVDYGSPGVLNDPCNGGTSSSSSSTGTSTSTSTSTTSTGSGTSSTSDASSTADASSTGAGTSSSGGGGGSPGTLFFSQYVEGGEGSNKALELYNASAGTIDLSDCDIQLHDNTDTAADATLALTGSIAPGDTFVICRRASTSVICPDVNTCSAACDLGTTSGAMLFTGNDTVVLLCGAQVVDVIGQVGTLPANPAQFGTSPDDTLDVNLIRDCNITTGDTVGSDTFTASEWTGTDYTNQTTQTAAVIATLGVHCGG